MTSSIHPAILDQLACPACLGTLSSTPRGLLCSSCGRIYPVSDGIPVLIPDRAEIPEGRKPSGR